MKYETVWDELLMAAMAEPEYQWHIKRVETTEMDFLAVCEKLTAEDRLAIEDYLAACEGQGDYLICLAYRLGKRKEE